MGLIEHFTDYVVYRRNLKAYVEWRKSVNERGEFNDETLKHAEDDLQRLKREAPEIYDGMYEVFYEIIRRDEGCYVEYPIDFIKQILRIYRDGVPAAKVLESYRQVLDRDHKYAC